MLTRSCKRRPTQTHPPSSYKQIPLSTTSRKHNYIHPYSLSTFSPFNPADSKTHTHFSSTFDELNSCCGYFLSLCKVKWKSALPVKVYLYQTSFISRRHMHTQTNSFSYKYVLPFANCFDVRYCVLTVTLHRNCTTAVSNTVISKCEKCKIAEIFYAKKVR